MTSVSFAVLRRIGVFFSVLLCSSSLLAQHSEIPLADQTPLSVYPGAVRAVKTKYPSSTPAVILIKKCDESAPTAKTFTVGKPVQLTIAGPGAVLSDGVVTSPCKITATLALDSDVAVGGSFIVNVTQEGTDRGFGVLTLIDAATGPYPTPTPQVDVIWGVQSTSLCKANFGRAVSKAAYCIEIKIGNNTGHQLQLAGIGFRSYLSVRVTPESLNPGSTKSTDRLNALSTEEVSLTSPNIGYQSVRAASLNQGFTDPRNLAYNIPQGTALLMAAFNPFFHAAYSLTRWTAGTAIVGTAVPGFVDKVVGDPVIRQLNALDDQAFRDGKLIPNNTQIRTLVFVDRKAFEGFGGIIYQQVCGQLYGKESKAYAKCEKNRDDPTAVKIGLGRLTIVGDLIDFTQRVVVDSTVTSQAVNPNQSATGANGIIGSNKVMATVLGLTSTLGVTATITGADGGPIESRIPLANADLLNGSLTFKLKSAIKDGDDYTITVVTPTQALNPVQIKVNPQPQK